MTPPDDITPGPAAAQEDRVRDGLPTVEECRQAIRLLQIPYDPDALGLGGMTPERRLLALLGLINAWVNAYTMIDGLGLSLEDVTELVATSEGQVSDGMTTGGLNLAQWRLQWAALSAEAAQGTATATPGDAVGELLRAAGLILHAWAGASSRPGITIGEQAFSQIDVEQLARAGSMALAGVDSLARFIRENQIG